MEINTDPSCSKIMEPDMGVLGLDITMVLGGSTGHPDQYGPGIILILRHQHGLKWLTRPLALAQHSMVSGAIDINTDPGRHRATEPDMALGSSLIPDDTMVPAGSAGYSDQHGPGGSMALGQLHGHRLWPRSRASIWPLVATCSSDINTDASCGRTKNSDMILSSSPGLDVTMASDSNTGTQISMAGDMVIGC
ncbi:hypothetical protein STEG23_027917 [Scotinomys teguina]